MNARVDGELDDREMDGSAPFLPIVGVGVRLLFVGVNPGLSSARVQAPFANNSNRFWRTLHRSGMLDRVLDTSKGLSEDDRAYLMSAGIGIETLVTRPTRRADELAPEELVAGVVRLQEVARVYRPTVVAILGIAAYRIAFRSRSAQLGLQPGRLEGAEVWVVPNPSGLNARYTLEDLVAAYTRVAEAASLPSKYVQTALHRAPTTLKRNRISPQ